MICWIDAPDADAVLCTIDVLAIGALFDCNSRGWASLASTTSTTWKRLGRRFQVFGYRDGSAAMTPCGLEDAAPMAGKAGSMMSIASEFRAIIAAIRQISSVREMAFVSRCVIGQSGGRVLGR